MNNYSLHLDKLYNMWVAIYMSGLIMKSANIDGQNRFTK